MKRKKTRKTPSVAAIIDGENISYLLTGRILAQSELLGEVTFRQIYLKEQDERFLKNKKNAWQQVATCYAFDLVQQIPTKAGHNALDIALTVGAMDLLYAGVQNFCLATSDSDYVALVQRLRRAGGTVLVIGSVFTPLHLQKACTHFLSTDELPPPVPWSRTWEVVKEQPSLSPSPITRKQRRNGKEPSLALTKVDMQLMGQDPYENEEK